MAGRGGALEPASRQHRLLGPIRPRAFARLKSARRQVNRPRYGTCARIRGPTRFRRAVEADIIPRPAASAASRQRRSTSPTHAGGVRWTKREIRVFAGLLLCQNEDRVVLAHLDGLRARGLSLDVLYLDLFQPAARHIGELWHADLCTFVDVTLAIGTMQKLLRTFGPGLPQERPACGRIRARRCWPPLPGDQHTVRAVDGGRVFSGAGGWSVVEHALRVARRPRRSRPRHLVRRRGLLGSAARTGSTNSRPSSAWSAAPPAMPASASWSAALSLSTARTT